MTNLETENIRSFLEALGQRYKGTKRLYLLGGSALCLLGNPRPTIDIDYLGDDLSEDDLQKLIRQIAEEKGYDVEPVPIERFLPLPPEAEQRSIFYGSFGGIDVFIYDPYTIALSKIDRGFDTDLDDVVFLIKNNLVALTELIRMMNDVLPVARQFDIESKDMLDHLKEVQSRLGLDR